MNVIRSITLLLLICVVPVFTGCAQLDNVIDSISQNTSQQFIVKNTIQLAVATYLGNSPEAVPVVVDVTDKVMLYLSDDDIYGKTTIELQKSMGDLIHSLDMTVAQKVALTGLAEMILAEAMRLAEINLQDKITQKHANALFFCANAMNETAKMFTLPADTERSFSINAPIGAP